MKKAIGLRFVPYEESKHADCHFLGGPLLPKSLVDCFGDEVLFLGMIDLEKVAEFDADNVLPHHGHLYFFFDTKRSYRKLEPLFRYSKAELDVMVDDFNEAFLEECPNATTPLGIEFCLVDEDAEGCKLLGVPCDWNYPDPPKGKLLLTVSHYDAELDFLPVLDGFTYVFFGPEGKSLEEAYCHYEYA